MTRAETKRDEIFLLARKGQITNMMHAVLLAETESIHLDRTDGENYEGTIIFAYADDSELKIDTEGYCYAGDDEEIARLEFND